MDSHPESTTSLDEILVSSRSFTEYLAFFDLDAEKLPARTLDCAAGASSFVAEADERGSDAIAVDPLYGLPSEILAARTAAGVGGGRHMIDAHADRFIYDWYQTPERRAEMRRSALARFEEHYRAHPERYVAAALPELPFGTESFDLALCSHLLFTWATHLDEKFHVAALVELCRVASEVRVFPLVLQATGEPVPFLAGLRRRLDADHGIASEIVEVPYVFQIGASHMMRLRRP